MPKSRKRKRNPSQKNQDKFEQNDDGFLEDFGAESGIGKSDRDKLRRGVAISTQSSSQAAELKSVLRQVETNIFS